VRVYDNLDDETESYILDNDFSGRWDGRKMKTIDERSTNARRVFEKKGMIERTRGYMNGVRVQDAFSRRR
jgi:hypothetical protein